MNLILTRQQAYANGIFGFLKDEDDNQVAVTLEHAYSLSNGGYGPKLAVGTYVCKRGTHQLHGMAAPFTTFEITEVPDFLGLPVTGVLFHCGNFNRDSEGCVLLGMLDAQNLSGIVGSREDFGRFMALQEGCDLFTLVVR